jgi:hypothetical protein
MKCEIQWIDCAGRSTEHDAQAIAYAVHKEKRYPICADHLETLKGRRSHHQADCPHLGGFYFAGLWSVEPLIDPDLAKRYRWFREHGSVTAVWALALARAEQTAKKRGLHAVWEDEDESYESVYGEPLDESADGPFWVWVPHPEKQSPFAHRWPIASLGMVTLAKTVGRDPYARFVEAELFSEALDVLDEEDEQAAHVLAQRATYAGVLP